MQIKETIGVSFRSSVDSPPPEDVVVPVNGADVALGVKRAFSARVRSVRDGSGGLIARAKSIDGFVVRDRLAAMAGPLAQPHRC